MEPKENTVPPEKKAPLKGDATLGVSAAQSPMDGTPGGWTQPPLLRDEPSELAAIVQTSSKQMPPSSGKRYQLQGEIARGGMGVILKGRDSDLGRDLAFKVLKLELAKKPEAVQRFVEEAQIGGQLQHPGIVPIYDMGRFKDGRPFFAMKLVKGRTLADLLAERKPSAKARTVAAERGRFLHILLQMCQTMAYAHSKGVIHRDLKPSNIMVGAYGEVLVMDWGLAKVLPRGGVADEAKESRAQERSEKIIEPTVIHTARVGSGSETEAGSILGTLAYMPPEQAGGEIDKLDERADVFGLGGVLCMILTGQPPYVGKTAEEIRLMAVRGKLGKAFARLDECDADAELTELCKQCLAPEAEDRPRNAGEVAAKIAGYLAKVEARAHEAEVERAKLEAKSIEERKRRRVQLALAASLLALLALIGGVSWWLIQQSMTERAQLAQQKRDAEGAVDTALIEVYKAIDGGRLIDAERTILDAETKLKDVAAESELRNRVSQARSDHEFLRTLERIAIAEFELATDEKQTLDDTERTFAKAKALRSAFEAYGFPAWDMDEAQIRGRLTTSEIREKLNEALIDLSRQGRGKAIDPRLMETMERLDTDPFRRRLANARRLDDATEIMAIAEEPELLRQPVFTVSRVLNYIRYRSAPLSGVALANLRKARLAHPTNAALHREFALMLKDRGRPEHLPEAIGYAEVAVALQPQSALVVSTLGSLLFQNGQTESAILAFRKTTTLDPKFATGHQQLAYALYSKNQWDPAIASLQKAIEIDPKSDWTLNLLGVTYKGKKDWDKAEAAFRKAMEANPKSEFPVFNLGRVYTEKRDYESAAATFSKAIEINPKYTAGYVQLGAALARKGDEPAALAAFAKAKELDPKQPDAFSSLGNEHARVKAWDAALAAHKKAIELNPNNARVHEMFANNLREKGDFDAAIARYRMALDLDPKDFTSNNNVGVTYADKKDWDAAIAAYRKAIELRPTSALAFANLAVVLSEKKDWHGALDAWRQARDLAPDAPDKFIERIRFLEKEKRWDAAVALLNAFIERNPKSTIGYFQLGLVNYRQKKWDDAIRAYRKAIELRPDNWTLHHNLGAAHLDKDEPDQAAAAFRRAANLAPTNHLPVSHLGRALAKKKDWDGALGAWAEAKRLNPKAVDGSIVYLNQLQRAKDWDSVLALGDAMTQRIPNSAVGYHARGVGLQGKKEWDGAIAAYRSAIARQRNFQPAHAGLGAALGLSGRPAEALRETEAILAQFPEWAKNPRSQLSYNLACASALCAAGAGKDVPPPEERPKYRARALQHLSADLARKQSLLTTDPKFVAEAMEHWLNDPDFTSVREVASLDRLPVAERNAWLNLWIDVEELLEHANLAQID